MSTSKLAAMLAVASLLASQPVTAADAGGAIIAAQCNGCHGFEGASKGAAPALKGKPAQHLSRSMKDYKSGKAKGSIMNRIAKGYSDAELDNVAKYYSGLK
ncbi:MAG: c-type cytochrome [Burkholderiales bacterium]|nr:c-type cytochrome [Burkholderiales bacterium]